MRDSRFFGPLFKIDITALAASNPLLVLFDLTNPHLSLACFILNAVMIPFPIGLLYEIDKFKIDL